MTDAQREIDSEKSTLKGYLSERFASDDQILSRLPKLVSQIVTEPEVSEDEKSMEQWCKAIISFRAAEIKARIDTVFLTNASGASQNGVAEEGEEDLKERKVALQAELEELHSEIASVAEMVVEHEIRKPMTEMKERRERDRIQARTAWLNYVSSFSSVIRSLLTSQVLSTLEYMGKRLSIVTTGTQDTDEFQQALAHMQAAAVKRIPETHPPVATPGLKRMNSGTSAFTPMVKLKPTSTLDLPVTLQDALRYAGISFSHDNIESLQDVLQQAQLERSKKLQSHYESTATTTHEVLAERTSKADGDLRAIMSALYKHAPFQQATLTNPELDEQLKAMELELEMKDRELLDAEGSELSLSDARVRAFIGKHGK
jgi:hypothetical protein